MQHSPQALLAAELADRWIETVLSEQPDLLLHADGGETDLSPHDMAQNLTQFRASLIEALQDQPLYFSWDDAEEDEEETGK